jgi:hypothetical protein
MGEEGKARLPHKAGRMVLEMQFEVERLAKDTKGTMVDVEADLELEGLGRTSMTASTSSRR